MRYRQNTKGDILYGLPVIFQVQDSRILIFNPCKSVQAVTIRSPIYERKLSKSNTKKNKSQMRTMYSGTVYHMMGNSILRQNRN